MARDWRRWAAPGAAAVAVLARVPFAARRLWDHDSVQFALGVERYDLAAHHPHPPGYPLYIGILKALAAVGVDALHGMVALSILAAALGAWLIVPLTARLVASGEAAGSAGGTGGAGDRRAEAPDDGGKADPERAGVLAGLFAAALYVFDPLLWFYGELPLVYAVEGGMTVGLAWAALRMGDGRARFLAGCAAFALAGGIRPSTLVLLLPLFLFGVWRAWRRGLRWGGLAAGAGVALAVGLAWLLPLLAAAGGLAAYQRIGKEHFSALLPYTSVLYGAGWAALAHNLTIMTKWFLQGLLPAAVATLGLWAYTILRRKNIANNAASSSPVVRGLRLLAANGPLLGVWVLPPVLFFALFHITKAGYTLVYLPGLLVAASLLAAPALAAAGRNAPPADAEHGGAPAAVAPPFAAAPAILAILLAAGAGAALFLFGADRRPDQPRALALVRNEFNRGSIAAYERDLDRLLSVLRSFPPATTVLGTVELSGTGAGGPEAFLYPWQRHLQWYLPAYEVIHLVPEEPVAFVARGHRPFQRAGTVLTLPPATRRLALVLAGPTGERFPLGAWPPRRIGDTFLLVIIPISGQLRLGPFEMRAAAVFDGAAGRRGASPPARLIR
jgi:hypothetical protein